MCTNAELRPHPDDTAAGGISLEELLAGRLPVGDVPAEKATGAVPLGVPGVVAGRPGQRRSKRVEQVVERPAEQHHVVRGEDIGQDDCGQTDTCRMTEWGRRRRRRRRRQ